jgi:hypothetical protein
MVNYKSLLIWYYSLTCKLFWLSVLFNFLSIRVCIKISFHQVFSVHFSYKAVIFIVFLNDAVKMKLYILAEFG